MAGQRGIMAVHRLRNLIVREVSLVDRPAIKESFYIVKRLNEEKMAEDQKLTMEEVIKRHTEYQTGVSTRIQETKAFLEGALEREVDTETRGTLSKALESLDALAKMKHPGPMMMEPEEEDEEHMKGKKKAKKAESEETQKVLVEGASFDFTKQNEVLAGAVTKGLEVPLMNLTKALEGIGKMVEDVSKEQEAIKRDLETKANRDEVANRKGVTKNSTELPKEEDVIGMKKKLEEGEGFETIRKSDAYDKANPQERLRMFARHFARQ